MNERWVCIGWDHKRHNSAHIMHTGDERTCKKLMDDFMRKEPCRVEAVAMTEREWRRILDADTRGD